MVKYTIRKSYTIHYAHRVYNQKKTVYNEDTPCKGLHGHTGRVTVELTAHALNDEGMVIDFTDLKPIKEFIHQFDHNTVLSVMDPMKNAIFDGEYIFKDIAFPFMMFSKCILYFGSNCSSEALAHGMFNHIDNLLEDIKANIGVRNDVKLVAVEFAETDNNVCRVEK